MEFKDLSTITLADIQRAQELIKMAKHVIGESTVDEAVSNPAETYEIIDTRKGSLQVSRGKLTGFRWDPDEELTVVTTGSTYYLSKSNGIKFLHDIGVNLPYPY